MPKTLVYIIGATQSDLDTQVAEIARVIPLDRDRGDKAFAATPSELRNPPAKRPKFQQLVSSLKPYDTLVTTRMNHLGRTIDEVLDTVKQPEWKNVHLHCLELSTDHRAELTKSDRGMLIMHTLAAAVALERGEKARRRAARHKTKIQGRPPALSANKRREVRDRLRAPDATVTAVARVMKVAGQPSTEHANSQASTRPFAHACEGRDPLFFRLRATEDAFLALSDHLPAEAAEALPDHEAAMRFSSELRGSGPILTSASKPRSYSGCHHLGSSSASFGASAAGC